MRKLTLTLVAVLACLALAAFRTAAMGASVPPPKGVSGLFSGIARGEASVVVYCTGGSAGDILRIDAANLSDQRQRWTIAPGVVARSQSPSAPDLAIRRLKGKAFDAQRYEPVEAIDLEAGQRGSFLCEAYSLNFARPSAPSAARYALAAPQVELQRLFDAAEKAHVSTRALQGAIWLLLGAATQEQIERDFPLSPEEMLLAQGLARATRESKAGQPDAATAPPTARQMPAAPHTKPSSAPAGESVLVLAAGNEAGVFAEKDRRRALVPVAFRWNVPWDDRPRHYAAVWRFETDEGKTHAFASAIMLDEEEGRFDAVVEQGSLKGKGALAYGIFADVTPAAEQEILDGLFDEPEMAATHKLSNVLRVAIDWEAPSRSALAMEPTPLTAAPPPAATRPLATPPAGAVRTDAPPAETLPSAPALSPSPGGADAAAPVEIALPLKNGGQVRGSLHGKANGRLLLEYKGRRFEFDPSALRDSPQGLLAKARTASREGRDRTALGLASVAALLLDNPAEALALATASRERIEKAREKFRGAKAPAAAQ